jgi:hypothetical protein
MTYILSLLPPHHNSQINPRLQHPSIERGDKVGRSTEERTEESKKGQTSSPPTNNGLEKRHMQQSREKKTEENA